MMLNLYHFSPVFFVDLTIETLAQYSRIICSEIRAVPSTHTNRGLRHTGTGWICTSRPRDIGTARMLDTFSLSKMSFH